MATNRIITLKHNDKVILRGKRGTVGTVGGYAAQYNEDPVAAIAHTKRMMVEMPYHGHCLYWINQEAACICSYPGHYERENAKWANAIVLEDGDTVWLENELLTVKYNGDYSNMGKFIPSEGHTFREMPVEAAV